MNDDENDKSGAAAAAAKVADDWESAGVEQLTAQLAEKQRELAAVEAERKRQLREQQRLQHQQQQQQKIPTATTNTTPAVAPPQQPQAIRLLRRPQATSKSGSNHNQEASASSATSPPNSAMTATMTAMTDFGSSAGSGVTAAGASGGPISDVEARQMSLTYEQREAKYLQVRERIFGKPQDPQMVLGDGNSSGGSGGGGPNDGGVGGGIDAMLAATHIHSGPREDDDAKNGDESNEDGVEGQKRSTEIHDHLSDVQMVTQENAPLKSRRPYITHTFSPQQQQPGGGMLWSRVDLTAAAGAPHQPPPPIYYPHLPPHLQRGMVPMMGPPQSQGIPPPTMPPPAAYWQQGGGVYPPTGAVGLQEWGGGGVGTAAQHQPYATPLASMGQGVAWGQPSPYYAVSSSNERVSHYPTTYPLSPPSAANHNAPVATTMGPYVTPLRNLPPPTTTTTTMMMPSGGGGGNGGSTHAPIPLANVRLPPQMDGGTSSKASGVGIANRPSYSSIAAAAASHPIAAAAAEPVECSQAAAGAKIE